MNLVNSVNTLGHVVPSTGKKLKPRVRYSEQVGKKFGMILILRLYKDPKNKKYKCFGRCDCGTEKLFQIGHVVRGNSTNCGCLHSGHPVERHGLSRVNHLTYRTWLEIKRRCYTEQWSGFKDYGGRGITVCDRWRASFLNFLEDMGKRPNKDMTIERKDVNGHYEPENCIWIHKNRQMCNTRATLWINFEGEIQCAKHACQKAGISYVMFKDLKRGSLKLLSHQQIFDKLLLESY